MKTKPDAHCPLDGCRCTNAGNCTACPIAAAAGVKQKEKNDAKQTKPSQTARNDGGR